MTAVRTQHFYFTIFLTECQVYIRKNNITQKLYYFFWKTYWHLPKGVVYYTQGKGNNPKE